MATEASRLANLSDSNAELPLKALVLPAWPASMLKRFPELETHHKAQQAAVDDWVKAANVKLQKATGFPS